MYEEYDFKLIAFDDLDVFADLSLASDADEEGGGSSQHSIQPDRSDY